MNWFHKHEWQIFTSNTSHVHSGLNPQDPEKDLKIVRVVYHCTRENCGKEKRNKYFDWG